IHRLVQPPTTPRRDRHDPARRARRELPSPPDRAGTRRRGTCEPLTNPGRFKVAAGGGSRRQIEAGQAAVWEPGEMHQSWATVDMLVAIVETQGEIELGEQFVEIHD